MQSAAILIDRVQRLVKDGSFDPSFILELMNDGLFDICILVNPPDCIVYNYEMSFFKNEAEVKLPDDFLGPRILSIKDKYGNKIDSIFYRVEDFDLSKKSNKSTQFCVKGKTIIISPGPEFESTYYLTYRKEPVIFSNLSDDGSEINYLPTRVGDKAVIEYATWKIYEHIEDGIDGATRNTEKFKSMYAETIASIANYFGIESKEKAPETILLTDSRSNIWGI